MTTRAAVFRGEQGRVELTSLPTPQPQSGEVLVAMEGCTLCASDLHSLHGRRHAATPVVLGHEMVGVIEAIGGEDPPRDLLGQPLEIGNRVTWSIVRGCGQCFYCRRHLPQKCPRILKYGHHTASGEATDTLLRGGLAERCLLAPGTDIVPLPESLSLAAACPANCATSTVAAVYEAAGRALAVEPRSVEGNWMDKEVLVVGAGMLGLTAIAMGAWLGATVWAVEPSPTRRKWAERLGATALSPNQDFPVHACNGGEGVDCVIEMSGSPQGFLASWKTLRMGGAAVLAGAVFPSDPVTLHLEEIVRRQATIRGVHNYLPRHLLRALEFLQFTTAPLGELVSSWHTLDNVQSALDAAQDPNNIRVGVKPNA